MTIEIVVPQVGEAVSEVTLLEWLKEVGDTVRKGEVLFLVDTEKATIEVEAFMDGTLVEILIPEGSAVMPQQVVGLISEEAEPTEGVSQVDQKVFADDKNRRGFISPIALRIADELGVDLQMVEGTGGHGRINAEDVRNFAAKRKKEVGEKSEGKYTERTSVSPKAKRLAKKLGVDLTAIVGSGDGGMINAVDVETAAKIVQVETDKRRELVPFSKRRRAVARHMIASKDQVPHFYLMVDVDMSNVNQLRARCVEDAGWQDPPTYTDIIVRACAFALKNISSLNVRYSAEGIIHRSTVDIGVAVGLDDGLIVPVVTHADNRNLKDTSKYIREVSNRARSGTLRDGDLASKSMVVSNLGMFGVDAFVAIIDLPDPMILAVGQVVDRVVPMDGEAVIRSMCTLSLSIDHRVLDGIQGAKFLAELKAILESRMDKLE